MRRKYFLCSMGKYVCFLAVCVVMLSSCYNDDDLKTQFPVWKTAWISWKLRYKVYRRIFPH